MTELRSLIGGVPLGPEKDDPLLSSSRTVIWLLCHYPETLEVEERIQVVTVLYHALRVPVWLFGSASARYPDSVESIIRQRLVEMAIPKEAIWCSGEKLGGQVSLDTVQEAENVCQAAVREGVTTLICVSNRLQLLQVHGLLRKKPLRLILLPTRLRDRRWWYVIGRLVLIPLAYLGVGRGFWPLVWVRRARGQYSSWPF